MGWRERDWAKFRTEEFDAIYGRGGRHSYASSSSRGREPDIPARRRRRRRFRAPRVLVLLATAVAGTAVIFGVMIVSGHVPESPGSAGGGTTFNPIQIPIVSSPPIVQAPKPAPHVTRIAGTRILQRGGTLTLSGRHTPEAGSITILGRWDSGPWETFGVADATRTTYSLRIPLTRFGVLHLAIRYPDGSRAVGTYRVE